MKYTTTIIVMLMLLGSVSPSQFEGTSGWGAYQVTLHGNSTMSAGTIYTYSLPLDDQSDVTQLSMSLCGYQLAVLNTISFASDSAYHASNNTGVLSVQLANGTSGQLLSFDVAVLTTQLEEYMERVKVECQFDSPKYHTQYGNNYVYQSYGLSLQRSYPEGSVSVYGFEDIEIQQSVYSRIHLDIDVYLSNQTVELWTYRKIDISSLRVTVNILIYQANSGAPFNAHWLVYSDLDYSSLEKTNMGVEGYAVTNCVYWLQFVFIGRQLTNSTIFFNITQSGITNSSQIPVSSEHYTQLTILCIGGCQKNTQYQLNTSDICRSCSTLTPNCVTCSSTECLSCGQSYVLVSGSCQVCSSLYPNCLECTATQCLTCESSSVAVNGSCTGCSFAYPHCETCDQQKCLSCNSSQHYLDQGRCCHNNEYYDSQKGGCQSCTAFSRYCSICSGQKCLYCDSGALLLDGWCYPKSPFLVMIALSGLVLMGAAMLVCWHNECKKCCKSYERVHSEHPSIH